MEYLHAPSDWLLTCKCSYFSQPGRSDDEHVLFKEHGITSYSESPSLTLKLSTCSLGDCGSGIPIWIWASSLLSHGTPFGFKTVSVSCKLRGEVPSLFILNYVTLHLVLDLPYILAHAFIQLSPAFWFIFRCYLLWGCLWNSMRGKRETACDVGSL